MAKNQGYTTDIKLAETPDNSAVPAKLYDAFLSLFQAFHSIAKIADAVYGLQPRDEAERVSIAQQAFNREVDYSDRLSVIYVVAGEDIEYGKLLSIRSDGKAYKAFQKTYFDGTFTISYLQIIGFCARETATGEVCAISTLGYLGGGAIQGKNLVGHYSPAGIVAYPPNPLVSSVPVVGEAFRETVLFRGHS
jgi:hypothetical protein